MLPVRTGQQRHAAVQCDRAAIESAHKLAASNPCIHVPKLKVGDGYAPWPWEMIELAERELPPYLWHAAALALCTGQRQSDMLKMLKGARRGGTIQVR